MTNTGEGLGSAIPDLPRSVYLDTQFVYAYIVQSDADHEVAGEFAETMQRLSDAGLLSCYISIIVLDELAWSLAGPVCDSQMGEGTWQRSNRQEAFVAVREEVAALLRGLMEEGWLKVCQVDADTVEEYPDALIQYPLAPADAAHMAVAIANDLGGIVTNDYHFHDLDDCPLDVIGY